MKNIKMMLAFMLILVFSSGLTIVAEEHQETPPFVQELTYSLQQRGWTQEEITRFTTQARELSWEGTEGADAQLVAYALSYRGEHQDNNLNRARLALELASSTMEMERMGVDRATMAQSAVRGVRNVISQSEIPGKAQNGGNPGEMIREAVRENLRAEEANRARVEARSLGKEQTQSGRPSNAGRPSGPPSSAR
ncbi:MAG: hypothetical protein ACQEQU_09650 [Spirochaetota bacterium]